jgi:hypothetical protein
LDGVARGRFREPGERSLRLLEMAARLAQIAIERAGTDC